MPSLLSRSEEIRALRLARSQPASAGEFQELLDQIRERTVEAVLADERVRARVGGVRHRVLAADYREDKPSTEEAWPRRMAEVGIYDYDRGVLVVAVVDLREGSVIELDERPNVRPPVADEELRAAVRLVPTDHPHHGPLNQPGTQVVAFPTPAYRAGHGRAAHRSVTLYFAPVPGSPDVAQVTVDLSTEEVVPEEEVTEGSPRSARGPQAVRRQPGGAS